MIVRGKQSVSCMAVYRGHHGVYAASAGLYLPAPDRGDCDTPERKREKYSGTEGNKPLCGEINNALAGIFPALWHEALCDRLKAAGITNLYACVGDPVDEADAYLSRDSERFHRSLGFEKIGTMHRCGRKFGRLYNMVWMEKII